MIESRVSGHVIAKDLVHGIPTWKVRINDPNHPLHDKKCRVVTLHDGYEPERSDTVTFALGSKQEGGQTILLAYDVRPSIGTKAPKSRSIPDNEPMNWFLVKSGDGIYAQCLGCRSIDEAAKLLEDDEVIAFIPFRIEEHLTEWEDAGVQEAFALIAALQRTTPTLVGLEKLITALVREAIKLAH